MFRETAKLDIQSPPRIVVLCLIASFAVFASSLLLQWLIYDDWLHDTGPVRIIGSAIAAVLTFVGLLRWQQGIRARHQEMLRRFETIARMNDQIRNALQVIECSTYIADPVAAAHVREAVTRIDHVLQGVVAEVKREPYSGKKRRAAAMNDSGAGIG